jgi:outer membrane lipase/esterase
MSGKLTSAASAGRINRWIALCAVLSLVVLVGIPTASYAHGNSHDREIIFFGDSLSDNGNAAALGAPITVPPFAALIPDGPYFPSLVFSNGPPWVVHFARRLNTPESALAALAFPGLGNNYAVGGGRARDVAATLDLPEQVGIFLSAPDSTLESRDWVVIVNGGNDIRDSIVEFGDVLSGTGSETQALASAAGILCEAVASIESNIELLHQLAGATKYFVGDGPDLGITPAITSLEPVSPGISALATQLSELFNQLLVNGDTPLPGTGGIGICALSSVSIQGLSALESSLEDTEIVRFHVFELLNAVADKPKRFGLSNSTDSCITPGVIVGAICPDPDENLFWDGLHATAAMHRIIARRAFFELLKGSWKPKKAWGKLRPWGFNARR